MPQRSSGKSLVFLGAGDPWAIGRGAGSPETCYRFVAQLRAELEAGAAPVIRFEELPGEYVQWDWGKASVRLGSGVFKRVFLAGRLKYSRVGAVRSSLVAEFGLLARTRAANGRRRESNSPPH